MLSTDSLKLPGLDLQKEAHIRFKVLKGLRMKALAYVVAIACFGGVMAVAGAWTANGVVRQERDTAVGSAPVGAEQGQPSAEDPSTTQVVQWSSEAEEPESETRNTNAVDEKVPTRLLADGADSSKTPVQFRTSSLTPWEFGGNKYGLFYGVSTEGGKLFFHDVLNWWVEGKDSPTGIPSVIHDVKYIDASQSVRTRMYLVLSLPEVRREMLDHLKQNLPKEYEEVASSVINGFGDSAKEKPSDQDADELLPSQEDGLIKPATVQFVRVIVKDAETGMILGTGSSRLRNRNELVSLITIDFTLNAFVSFLALAEKNEIVFEPYYLCEGHNVSLNSMRVRARVDHSQVVLDFLKQNQLIDDGPIFQHEVNELRQHLIAITSKEVYATDPNVASILIGESSPLDMLGQVLQQQTLAFAGQGHDPAIIAACAQRFVPLLKEFATSTGESVMTSFGSEREIFDGARAGRQSGRATTDSFGGSTGGSVGYGPFSAFMKGNYSRTDTGSKSKFSQKEHLQRALAAMENIYGLKMEKAENETFYKPVSINYYRLKKGWASVKLDHKVQCNIARGDGLKWLADSPFGLNNVIPLRYRTSVEVQNAMHTATLSH